jgi:hypothetical protein
MSYLWDKPIRGLRLTFLQELFRRIGPITKLQLRYDRSGRSEGVAFVTYEEKDDAAEAVKQFDGANANGMFSSNKPQCAICATDMICRPANSLDRAAKWPFPKPIRYCCDARKASVGTRFRSWWQISIALPSSQIR